MQRPGRDGPRAASTDELADYIAMIACASLAATGAVIAWLMIGADALEAEPKRRGRPPEAVPANFACSVAGPPLRSASKQASAVEP
jgi:hypothetical protein